MGYFKDRHHISCALLPGNGGPGGLTECECADGCWDQPPGTWVREAGIAAREAAKARLLVRVEPAISRAEELIIAIENDADTQKNLVRVYRRSFWAQLVNKRSRSWVDYSRQEILRRLGWKRSAKLLEAASAENAIALDAQDQARSDVRAAKLARTVEKLMAVLPDMRADGLEEEADVLASRLKGFGTETPDFRPYSQVVEDVDGIDFKPTAQRREKAALAWLREHRPHLLEDIQDTLRASYGPYPRRNAGLLTLLANRRKSLCRNKCTHPHPYVYD